MSPNTDTLNNMYQVTSDDLFSTPLEQVTTGFYQEDDHLRPDGVFVKGYRELQPYEQTAFGGVSLKRTRNGQRAKSGFRIERSISPKRR